MLVSLTRQAQSVLATQGRLRSLLRATAEFSGDLDLEVVVRRIVEASRELVDARYAALGLVRNGALVGFVHEGMDSATIARIGDLPKGLGLLGYMVNHPEPLRLSRLGDHPSAAGAPEHYPTMNSFLAVPIRIQDELFGVVYLTESRHGHFSEDDEQLMTALAHSAAAAIAKARVYAEVQEQRRWLAASTVLTQELFQGDARPTEQVARHAALGADADLAVIALPGDSGTLRIDAAAGVLADQLSGAPIEVATSLAGAVFSTGVPRLIPDFGRRIGEEDTAMLGPAVIVPLLARDEIIGTLTIARLANRATFTQSDVDHLTLFASHAGLALELDHNRSEQERVNQLLDRDRIATNLHDDIINDLFATAMGLQSLAGRLPRQSETHIRILETVNALDAVIHRIRETVFAL